MSARSAGRGAFRALAALGLLFTASCGQEAPPPTDNPPREEERTYGQPVHLYFPGESGLLEAERREIRTTGEPNDQVAAVVRLLLEGPASGNLVASFPEDTRLLGVVLSPTGIAYINLGGAEGAHPPPGGSTEERQRLMSLVNSVALNVTEVRRVVVLWNGVQPDSFGGHLDASRPFAPDLSWVARQP